MRLGRAPQLASLRFVFLRNHLKACFYETPQRVTLTEPIETIDGLDFTADAYGTPQTVNNEAGKDIEININKTDTINISGVEKQVSPTPIQFNF